MKHHLIKPLDHDPYFAEALRRKRHEKDSADWGSAEKRSGGELCWSCADAMPLVA